MEIAGITRQPNDTWMKQTARKLTDAQGGFLRSMRYLILDRDPVLCENSAEVEVATEAGGEH